MATLPSGQVSRRPTYRLARGSRPCPYSPSPVRPPIVLTIRTSRMESARTGGRGRWRLRNRRLMAGIPSGWITFLAGRSLLPASCFLLPASCFLLPASCSRRQNAASTGTPPGCTINRSVYSVLRETKGVTGHDPPRRVCRTNDCGVFFFPRSSAARSIAPGSRPETPILSLWFNVYLRWGKGSRGSIGIGPYGQPERGIGEEN